MRTPTSGSGIFRLGSRLAEDPSLGLYLGLLLGGQSWVVFLIAVHLIISLLVAGAAGGRRVSKFIAQARRSFFECDNLRLHPIDLDDIISPKILAEVQFRPSFARSNFQTFFMAPVVPFRAYWVEVLGPPFPTEWRAYPTATATQFIFVLDKPSKLTVHGKFRLLHELHHVSISGAGAATSRTRELCLLPALTIAVLSLAFGGTLPSEYAYGLVVLLFIYAVWQLTISPFEWNLLAEVSADSFAFKRLDTTAERREVLQTCKAVWGRSIQEHTGNWIQRLEWRLRLGAMTGLLASESTKDALRPVFERNSFLTPSNVAAYLWSIRQLRFMDTEKTYEEFGTHGALALKVVTFISICFSYGSFAAFAFFGWCADSLPSVILPALACFALVALVANKTAIDQCLSEFQILERTLVDRELIEIPSQEGPRKTRAERRREEQERQKMKRRRTSASTRRT